MGMTGEYWENRFAAMEDIGNGVRISYYGNTGDGPSTGLIVAHRHSDGSICQGSVLFDIPENAHIDNRPKWQLIEREPLHIEPSILQGKGHPQNPEGCLHGYIRNGRWENA